MRYRTLFMTILAVALATTAFAQETEDTSADSISAERILAGSATFNGGSCVICHAVAGRGSGARAPDLSDVEWLHSEGTFAGIQETIFWGVKRSEIKAQTPRPFRMNPSGGLNLTRPERSALAAYVWSLSRSAAYPFVARQMEFLELLEDGDTDAATAIFARQKREAPEHPLLPQRALNALGYQHLSSAPETALAVFLLNVEEHPDAWNPWDSLGDGYRANGRIDEAIEAYQKSLELNPDNQNATDQINELRAG